MTKIVNLLCLKTMRVFHLKSPALNMYFKDSAFEVFVL